MIKLYEMTSSSFVEELYPLRSLMYAVRDHELNGPWLLKRRKRDIESENSE
jgi:hypothetical protein